MRVIRRNDEIFVSRGTSWQSSLCSWLVWNHLSGILMIGNPTIQCHSLVLLPWRSWSLNMTFISHFGVISFLHKSWPIEKEISFASECHNIFSVGYCFTKNTLCISHAFGVVCNLETKDILLYSDFNPFTYIVSRSGVCSYCLLLMWIITEARLFWCMSSDK